MEPEPSHESVAETVPRLRRILIPTDFSVPCRRALIDALRLAGKSGAELTVLHVADTIQAPPACSAKEYIHMQEHSRQRFREEMDALVQELAPIAYGGPLLPPRLLAVEGIPSHEIIRVAQQDDIDLIVISTHGRTGFKRVFLGSTAEKVIRYATCSVLVVRDKENAVLPLFEES